MSKEIQSAISALIGTDKIKAIRVLMGLESPVIVTDAPGTITLKEVKAKDGSMLYYEGDMPMAGVAITIKDADGKDVPAPDGEVVLEDGSVLTIKNGKIESIKDAPASAEATPAFDAKEEMKRLKSTSEQAISDLKIQYKKDLIDLQATIKKQAMSQETNEKVVKEIFSIIEKIAELPSVPPVAPKKDGFNKTSLNPTLDALMASAKELSKKAFHN